MPQIGRSQSKEEFERCWPWLQASLDVGTFRGHNGVVIPTFRKEHIWERIAQGKALFWPGEECVFLTEFYTTPTGLKSHHTWLAGGELQAVLAAMPTIEDWGRVNDAHQQTGSGRRGWLRAFDGYQEVGVRKAKPLI